jgi:hypothetical protein
MASVVGARADPREARRVSIVILGFHVYWELGGKASAATGLGPRLFSQTAVTVVLETWMIGISLFFYIGQGDF